jgi:hypothetical protein
MGYCIEQVQQHPFIIRVGNFDAAHAAIKALHGRETVNDSSGAHFRFVDQKFYERTSLRAILSAWRWSVTRAPALAGGDIIAIEFEGQKLGDDDLLFATLAPFVESGSCIEMEGEDGNTWRWEFEGQAVRKVFV